MRMRSNVYTILLYQINFYLVGPVISIPSIFYFISGCKAQYYAMVGAYYYYQMVGPMYLIQIIFCFYSI